MSQLPVPGYGDLDKIAAKIRSGVTKDQAKAAMMSEASGEGGLIDGITQGKPSDILR